MNLHSFFIVFVLCYLCTHEKNKRRTASGGADDTSVLQEEGAQQGIMSWVPRVATVRYCKIATM